MDDYFNIRLADDDIRAISSIGLAHLGDAVYELLVRAYLCAHGRATGKGLHRAAVELVRAPSQAVRADRILPLLTEAELAVYKRGRNAHVNTIPSLRPHPSWQRAWQQASMTLRAVAKAYTLIHKHDRTNWE